MLEVGRRRPGLPCRQFNNPPVGWLVRGYRDDRDLRLSGEPAPVFVIDHDDATTGALLGEQRGLRREVVIEIVVEIQVVLGQVGKPGDVEHDGVDTPQDQRVAGNLHHAGSGTALAHDREQCVQLRRLRRGPHTGKHFVADPGLDGSDQPGDSPGGSQPGLHEVRRRRLAIGAGDPEHEQVAGGVAVDLSRELTE